MFTFRRALTVLVLALAVAAAGCSQLTGTGDPSVAATVNDERIAVSTVEAELDLAMAGAADGASDPEQVPGIQAEILQYLVRLQLLEQGAVELGIEFTDEDLVQAREDLAGQFGGQEMLEQQLETQGLDISDLDHQLKSQTLEVRINEVLAGSIDVSDEEVREAYELQFGDRPTVRHILLESEEEAAEVIAELEGGADFNELATERSIDPSAQDNAGELGTLQRGQTVPEFEQAAFGADPGEFVGPVESDFGFHVIEVTGFEEAEDPPPFEDIEEQLRGQIAAQRGGQAAFGEWIMTVAEAAQVEVNPRFGRWDAQELAVVPASALDDDG